MSLFPIDTFKVIAESVGITNIKDDAAAALAQDIEYRLRDIIQVCL
jgi:transcription initiation factor TFIID subunit 6